MLLPEETLYLSFNVRKRTYGHVHSLIRILSGRSWIAKVANVPRAENEESDETARVYKLFILLGTSF